MVRRASRTDQNQQSIVDALRACGVRVAVTSGVGNGFPDLVVAYQNRVTLIECKIKGEKLTPDQERFHDAFPVCVVRSVDDALLLFGIAT